MTYAGRLDPLAEGVLIVLYGDECKNKEKYLKLDKEYEVDVLFGFTTDTYDVLGKVTETNDKFLLTQFSPMILKSFIGKFSQKYPPYSSKFFNRARSGELKNSEITSKDVEIKSIRLLSKKSISKNTLSTFVTESVSLVHGDFRQKEILQIWKKVLSKNKLEKYPIISINVKCTSGTYMRGLANEIGKKVSLPALALKIKRTKVGDL